MNSEDRTSAPASLDLSIRRGANGASRLIRHRVSYPWSLGRGYPDGPDGGIMILPQVAGAGLLASDRVDQRIKVGAQASLHLASAGATLVHGRPGGPAATSRWTYVLGQRARAVIAAEPHVLLEDARLSLEQTIVIDPSATLVLVEGIVDASTVDGGEWASQTTVRRPNGSALLIDRQSATLSALSRHRAFPGRWRAFGSMLLLAPARTGDDVVVRIRETPLRATPSEWMGVARLRNDCGVGIRFAARDGALLRTAMNRALATLVSILSIETHRY